MTQQELIKRLETTCFGLDPIDPLRLLVDDVIEALAQQEERNFCPRCGKRTKDIHTCTPPVEEDKHEVSQEPVGEVLLSCGDYKEISWKGGKLPPVGAKLYTSPPQRQPLTDEQRRYVVEMWKGGNWTAGDIIDAVEAAHGIKEQP